MPTAVLGPHHGGPPGQVYVAECASVSKQAEMTFDQHHVERKLSDAIETVRWAKAKKLTGSGVRHTTTRGCCTTHSE